MTVHNFYRHRRNPAESAPRVKRWRYNITDDDYRVMLAQQGGACAVCGYVPADRERLAIDHDHACCDHAGSCGLCVRGLLCNTCNLMLGHVERRYSFYSGLVRYLNGQAPGT